MGLNSVFKGLMTVCIRVYTVLNGRTTNCW